MTTPHYVKEKWHGNDLATVEDKTLVRVTNGPKHEVVFNCGGPALAKNLAHLINQCLDWVID